MSSWPVAGSWSGTLVKRGVRAMKDPSEDVSWVEAGGHHLTDGDALNDGGADGGGHLQGEWWSHLAACEFDQRVDEFGAHRVEGLVEGGDVLAEGFVAGVPYEEFDDGVGVVGRDIECVASRIGLAEGSHLSSLERTDGGAHLLLLEVERAQ